MSARWIMFARPNVFALLCLVANAVAVPTTTIVPSSSSKMPEETANAVDKLVEIIDSNSTQPPTTTTPVPDWNRIKCKPDVEVFSNCTNSCPASCEDPNRKPCRSYCWSGCECAPGYVKNHRWQCIPVDQCPKCGENEHYRNCGSNCEPNCNTYQNIPVYCSNRASCKRGCFCNYGYVRDMSKNGTCVSISECPQKCGANEYWDVNGKPCVRTAENPRPACLFEPPTPACICNTGFRRDPATQQCVPITPTVMESKCQGNETFSFCGSECARNCFDENRRETCPTICHRGCFCNEGYRRDSTGRCVLPQDCRTWMSNGFETAVVFA